MDEKPDHRRQDRSGRVGDVGPARFHPSKK
jgi:hypothetical protein